MDHFVVCNGGEGAVKSAYSDEGFWFVEAEKTVDQRLDASSRFGRGEGDGYPDCPGVLESDPLNGVQQGSAGGDAIVDQ